MRENIEERGENIRKMYTKECGLRVIKCPSYTRDETIQTVPLLAVANFMLVCAQSPHSQQTVLKRNPIYLSHSSLLRCVNMKFHPLFMKHDHVSNPESTVEKDILPPIN